MTNKYKYQKGNKVLVKPFTTEDPKHATVIGLPHETSSNKYEVSFGDGWVGFFFEYEIIDEKITLKDAFEQGYAEGVRKTCQTLENALKRCK
jgi:hypothetical protein